LSVFAHEGLLKSNSKSKAQKGYEFGVKAGVVASLRKPFILAPMRYPENPTMATP
jgi:hypothetical protein